MNRMSVLELLKVVNRDTRVSLYDDDEDGCFIDCDRPSELLESYCLVDLVINSVTADDDGIVIHCEYAEPDSECSVMYDGKEYPYKLHYDKSSGYYSVVVNEQMFCSHCYSINNAKFYAEALIGQLVKEGL